MPPTATKRPTVTVRITRRLADAIAADYYPSRIDPADKFGPRLEPWVSRLLRSALRSAGKGKIVEPECEDPVPKRDAIVRLPRSQVKRLGIVSSITGVPVSHMVEEKLWNLLTT